MRYAMILAKVAAQAEKKEERPSYLKSVVAGLPVLGAQAVSDIPEGIIERSVENSVLAGKPRLGVDLGLLRFGSRLGAGAFTTPIFVSGMKDISEAKNKQDERRGMAKLIAAGGAYAGFRGAIEGAFDPKVKHLPFKQKVGRIAGTRAALGIGGAVLTGLTVGRSLRAQKEGEKPRGPKPGVFAKYIQPAAIGAGLAGGKGALIETMTHGRNAWTTPQGRRGVLAKSLGGAAAGGAATLFLSEIMKRALRPKSHEKKASTLFRRQAAWASSASTEELKTREAELVALNQTATTEPLRASLYAVQQEIAKRGGAPAREKVKIVKNPIPGAAGAALLAASVPALAWNVLAAMPQTERDATLNSALDRIALSRGIDRQTQTSIKHFGQVRDLAPGEGYASAADKIVYVGRRADPAILAHEIGHATGGEFRQKYLASKTSILSGRLGGVLGGLLPVAIAADQLDSEFARKEDVERKARFVEAAAKVLGVAQLPNFAEEATASAKALKYLADAGADAGTIARKGGRLGAALSTYAVPIAVPALMARGIRSGQKREPEGDSK